MLTGMLITVRGNEAFITLFAHRREKVTRFGAASPPVARVHHPRVSLGVTPDFISRNFRSCSSLMEDSP
jgi:hypothetical protein